VRQFQVLVDPARLASQGLALNAVIEAVQAANRNTSAGFLLRGGQEYLIHGQGRVEAISDLELVVVEARDGHPILVRDVADVVVGPALKRGTAGVSGQPGVVLGIQKQPAANTLALTKRLEDVLAEVEVSLPPGMTLHPDLFRQADFIDVAVENVTEALRDGALLVILILALFLVNARATMISALAIPLSLAVTILAMSFFRVTVNTMTLGGMAIAVGALVDDAIIDVENVLRRLRENAVRAVADRRSVFEVVFDASREIRGSIFFATLIIVLVFLPLMALDGVEGLLLAPLGFAYMVSLAASLLVALTATPVLCMLLLPQTLERDHGGDGWLVRQLKRVYARVLTLTLGSPLNVVTPAVFLFLSAGAVLTNAGTSFLPEFNEGSLTVGGVLPPGTSLEQSERLARMADDILVSQPEVLSTARRTGRAERDEHAQSVNASEWEVRLAKDADKEAVLARLRHELAAVPGMQIVIGQPISHRIDHMLSGTRANVAVKIFGDDLAELRRTAALVEAQMKRIEGVVDLGVEVQTELPFVRVRPDRAELARYGVHVEDVMRTMEAAWVGEKVSRVLEREAAYDLVVKLPESERRDFETLRSLPVRAHGGALVPLSALADIRRDKGPSTISREHVHRKIVVMCNVSGRDIGSVVRDIRARIETDVKVPAGGHIELGGQFESAESARTRLGTLGLAVIVFIFALLAMALRSSRDALLVMVNLPLALIGGVAGVLLSGNVVSVASLIGFITLFGIATRNGLIMITHFRHLVEEEGETVPLEVVRRGAMERLAPILMTALASALGLVPLALQAGEPGSEIQAPMAFVILCGLATSTVLNMIVVPTLYLAWGDAVRGLEKPAAADDEDEESSEPSAS
jgi:CzcA family heavy metal efflux pump